MGGVLGVVVGLLVLAMCALAVLRPRGGGAVDLDERAAALLRDGTPPAGWVAVGASRLSGGERVLRLERAPDADADPGAPEACLLVEYPSSSAVTALFRVREESGESASRRKLDWERDPDFAWHATLERGELEWGAWRAPFAIERAFQEGGGFRDAARVDLSRPRRPLVLHALWPAEVPAAHAPLRALLPAIRMEEDAPAASE
jgi:hypothetical protein